MRFLVLSIALAVSAVFAASPCIVAVEKGFEKAHIAPDLDIAFRPGACLEITFPQSDPSVPPITIQPGMTLSMTAASLQPTYHVSPANIGHGPFVLAMVDPDSPTPQNTSFGQIRHFLGGNFWLDKDTHLLTNSTPAITEFTGPHPAVLKGSDPHRYILLLFEQPRRLNDQTFITSTTDRRHFNISVFAEQVGMGNPIAGNYFMVGPNT